MAECGPPSRAEVVQSQEMTRLFGSLVRLVAEGAPVSLDRLATEFGRSAQEVWAWLQRQPGTDWDTHGRLLGFGLTQRPTQHRVIIDGHTLFAFCAADTLMFPLMLNQPMRVESRCPASGTQICVELNPNAVAAAEPAATVVSQLCLSESSDDIRATVCDHGHFYASPQMANEWQRRHPEGEVVSIKDLFTRTLADCRTLG